MVLVSLVYTGAGGMRATAWTNVFQGALFLAFMVAAFFLVSRSLGGLTAATDAVRREAPELLRIERTGLFEPRQWCSWALVISLTVIAFPHMLARLMAAGSERSLRATCRLYPLALLLLWVPAVLVGVWGAAAHPGLAQPDAILPLMAAEHMPELLAPLGLLAVLAAVMSTLDAQLLTLSSMLVRDVLDAFAPRRAGRADRSDGAERAHRSGRSDVLAGRAFVLACAAAVYALAQVWDESVFDISRLAFEGYTTLVPTLLLGVRWRRFNAAGAAASLLAGNAVLALGWLGRLETFGFGPVVWALAAGFAAGWLASVATAPPDADATARAFGEDPCGAATTSP